MIESWISVTTKFMTKNILTVSPEQVQNNAAVVRKLQLIEFCPLKFTKAAFLLLGIIKYPP